MPTGDLNQDGIVDSIDLSILVSNWNTADPDSDINNDGIVDSLDLSILVSNWGETTSDAGTALLVTNESTLSTGNQVLYDRLLALGYSVTVRLDSDPVDYTDIDLIVCGSITGSNIDGKYANPPVGMVFMDSWPHFGLGSSIGFENNVDTLQVTNDSHPLSGGLSNGNHVVYNTPGYLVWSTDYNSTTATIIANNPGQPTQPIVFGYEAGDNMQSAFATTRHVGLGVHRNVRADMTSAGWALFDAAITWAKDSAYVAPPPPSAPTNLSATAGDMQVSLSWSSVSGADSYNIKRSSNDGGPYTSIQANHTTTSFTDTNLTNGTTYYYVVSAVNSQGESDDSTQVSATPAEGSGGGEGSRFLYSDTQISEFQTRMSGAGPFYSTGQGFSGPQSNAPGDGERALGHANTFIQNPSQYTFYQTFGNGTSLEPGDPSPGSYIHNMRAAWCYMTMPNHANNTAWRNAARDMLISAAEWGNHAFANSSMYSIDYPGYAPSPIFGNAGGMIRNLKTYDMLGRDTFTTSQLELLDKWFYSWANWIARWHNNRVNNGRIPGMENGSWDITESPGLRDQVAFNGGPYISSFGMFTNRQNSCVNSAAMVAYYLKFHGVQPPTSGGPQPSYGWWSVDQIATYCHTVVKAWLRASLHPLGFTFDYHRAHTGSLGPGLGWLYASNEIAGMISVAKAAERGGASESLFGFGTTLGHSNTAGSPNDTSGVSTFPNKNLHYAIWMHSQYVANYWGRVVTSESTGQTGPLAEDHYYHDVLQAATVHTYHPSDSILQSAWQRSGNGFPGYPSSPQGQGSHNARDGEMSTYIGLIEVGGV